ncbi:MAG: class I SAM-dependent methyltransferase [Candidatus Omnitrophica bacterium]|nr:class I SAM-dependent methyltransferase [Candidatus Omnitrophota bacterium]
MDHDKAKANIEYWNKRALEYGETGQSTLLDNNMRMLEIETVQQWLEPADDVLDLFCGNGLSTLECAPYCSTIVGCDLSEHMIQNAQANLKNRKPAVENVTFEIRDALTIDAAYSPGQFNTVVSVRGLINLPSWEIQQEAILKIYNLLPGGGKYILIEGAKEGRENINALRRELSLPPLTEPWFNTNISSVLLDAFMKPYFTVRDERNLDIYFLISRILYPFACQPENPEFDNIANVVARLLVPYASTDRGTTLLISRCFIKR